jgi:hypothetical protein
MTVSEFVEGACALQALRERSERERTNVSCRRGAHMTIHHLMEMTFSVDCGNSGQNVSIRSMHSYVQTINQQPAKEFLRFLEDAAPLKS